MQWMTLLSETHPPIRQKTPLDVSSCHLQRASGDPRASGIPASGRLSRHTYRIHTIGQSSRRRRNDGSFSSNQAEDSSIGTSDSRPADSETGAGVDDKRVQVFCNGLTTVPEGNKGAKESAAVS